MQNESKLYFNGTIVTLDANNTIADALVTQNDKIIFVGEKNAAMQFIQNSTQFIDLQGKTLIPGFVDAHSHFSRAGVELVTRISLNSPPVGFVTSISELLQKIADKVAVTKPGEWIIGTGYDDTLLKEQRHPTRQELDSVSTDHPIWITHISNHFGVANSYALQLAQIDEDTPDPEGGVLRHTSDGQLDGVFEETAMFLIRKYLPDISDQIPVAIEAANQLYMRVGVTTANEGGVGGIIGDRADLSDYMKVSDKEQKIRLVLNAHYSRVEEAKKVTFKTSKIYLQGAKILADGSIQGYTGYLSKPYYTAFQGNDNYYGYPCQSREHLCKLISDLQKQDVQCYIHCNGDASIDDVLYAFEEAQKSTPKNNCRHVIVHCQMAREDQLNKMKKLNIIPSFFVSHIYYWGYRHRHVFLGEERAKNLNPCRWAIERQMPFTLHCDTPVVPQNPLLTIWTAVNRLTASGEPLGADIQSISPLEALKAYTINAAYQFFMEDKIGSLEVGKSADLVILDDNPLSCPPMHIKDIQVLETIVGGETVYKK